MADLLTTVEREMQSSILPAESYLAREPVGDQGRDPLAPPAAGGAL